MEIEERPCSVHVDVDLSVWAPENPDISFITQIHLPSQITTCKWYTETIESCWSSEHSSGYRGRLLKWWCYSLIHHLFYHLLSWRSVPVTRTTEDHCTRGRWTLRPNKNDRGRWNGIWSIPCVHGFLPRMLLRLILWTCLFFSLIIKPTK